MEVYKSYYAKLVKVLPMNDVTFIGELYSQDLLPGDLKSQVKSLSTPAEKASHFLDDVIEPSFSVNNNNKTFEKLISIMSKFTTVKELASEISDHISRTSLPLESQPKRFKSADTLDGLAILADTYSSLYIRTRFKKMNGQPYASNLSKSYTPLTLVRRGAKQRQEQLSAIAKEHREALNKSSEIVNVASSPLSLKLFKMYACPGDKKTKNVEDLFILPNTTTRPKSILVEGAPGIGKTELVKEIACCWAKKETLVNIKLVMVLYLHNPKVQMLNSVSMLVQLIIDEDLIDDELAECTVKQLRTSQGSDVLFLLDSFDECHNNLQKDSFVVRLIEGSVLSRSTVLITSRPSGSYQLRIQVDSIFEIHGFDEEDQSTFISLSLKESPKEKLENFLSANPIISSHCYIPLYLTMLVFLFSQDRDCLPETSTEVIEKFVLQTVLLDLNKSYTSQFVIPLKLHKLKNLPAEVFEIISQLSKIAFDGVITNQLVFTLEEMEKTCPDIRQFSNGFGLLQAVEHYPESGGVGIEVSVNFIHYSMQEFFAAFHISSLSDKEQYSLMGSVHQERNTFDDLDTAVPGSVAALGLTSFWHSQYANMWLMYIGLTGGESVALEKFVCKFKFQIPEDGRKVFLFFQYYTEVKSERMCQTLLDAFNFGKVINLGQDISDHQTTFLSHHMTSLVQLLSHNQGVHSVKFLNIFMSDDTLNILASYFEETNITVDCLHFKNNSLESSSAKVIGKIIKTNCLKTLILTDNFNCTMNGGIKEISNALFVNDSIHSLTLKGVVLRDDEICMLMDALAGKPIQHLNLSNNLGCCSEGAKAIAMFIGTCATLLSLTFSFDLMMLSEKGFESFVSQFRCHGKIIPEYIKCDLSGICALTDALNNNLSLTSLDISPPLFWECDEWWHKLTSNIQQMRSLKSLHLPGYNLNLNNVSALVHFIHFNKSLVSLNISGDSIDDTGMGALCNALCYNETLKLLDVSKNEVNFTDNIAQVLWNNYNLTCLALGSNKISDEGCRHLAIALSVNKTLTSLYVRDNMIGDDGAKELAGMFAKNATLLQMDLSFNDIRDEGAKALVNALCVSGGLKILLIIFNDIKFEECLLFNPHITIDNKFFAYTADFWNAIPLLSAQFVMGKHVYFTEQKFYGEWKGKKLNKINLQNVYNHIIPEDQLDCLKYYQQNEFGDNDSNNDDGGNNDSNNDD